jgi:hypothetical protein
VFEVSDQHGQNVQAGVQGQPDQAEADDPGSAVEGGPDRSPKLKEARET